MKKAWIIFILILIISTQFLAFSLFHEVDVEGTATGSSVIAIARWNYVGASVHISILPLSVNGSVGPIRLVLPNGTTREVTASSYSLRVQLPRTGGSFGTNGAISGPLALSQRYPLNVTISQNVQNVIDYVSSLQSSEHIQGSQGGLDAQLYVLIIYGDAQVTVSGYGVAF